jgi:hypothetical protein
MARRLDWTPGDPTPEWVRGELVIGDAGTATEYAAHLVDGHPVDPETLVAVASLEET